MFRELARQKESRIEEGHLQADHVHMLLSIPPKYAVAQVVGYLKGKAAIHIARTFMGGSKNLSGNIVGHGGTLFHRRQRGGGDPRVHPHARGGRSPSGSDRPVVRGAAWRRLTHEPL